MTIEEWFFKFATANWMRDDYNLVIMSAIYAEPPNLANMLSTFSFNTWFFIIDCMAIVSVIITIDKAIKYKCKVKFFSFSFE